MTKDVYSFGFIRLPAPGGPLALAVWMPDSSSFSHFFFFLVLKEKTQQTILLFYKLKFLILRSLAANTPHTAISSLRDLLPPRLRAQMPTRTGCLPSPC